ncbi:MAG: putative surface protein bspA-like [Candidatus Malacoplasma girerdii]|nr:MAG: putative surface protein bspA-like [Candidatus Malacoplasma girerdii]
MKLRNFTKFFTGIALISVLTVGVVISNPHTHSSLVVENKVTSDISWSIDDKGNIEPTDESKVSGEITIPDTVNGKTVTGIANNAFDHCSSLISVNFAEGSKLNSIGEEAFFGCESLKTIAIPSSVTSIGSNAFNDCSSLTSVNFDNDSQLTSINVAAFYNCSSLTSVNIPGSVTNIGNSAFDSCASLTSVTIPNSVTNIGKSAFEDCDKLTDVYLSWDENQIKKLKITGCVFDSASGQIKINFHIPKGMKELYIAQTKDWFDGSAVPNWIDDIVPPTPTPTNSSNLGLILGLIFGSIILIGIGSYLGYRYYKHRKNSKK